MRVSTSKSGSVSQSSPPSSTATFTDCPAAAFHIVSEPLVTHTETQETIFYTKKVVQSSKAVKKKKNQLINCNYKLQSIIVFHNSLVPASPKCTIQKKNFVITLAL